VDTPAHPAHRRRVTARPLAAAISAAFLAAACANPRPLPAPAAVAAPPHAGADAAVRAAIAPTGVLRIGVYPGSPTSMVRTPAGESRGLSVELGRALADRLGLPADLVILERVAQVVDGIAAGQVDMTITNASPARAQRVDFSPPVLTLELGLLVMPGSPVTSPDVLDREGIRVGVTQRSTSQTTLGQRLAHATLVPAASMNVAQQMLRDRTVDAFATNKAILFELGDGLPGSRVLEGRWGVEHLAIALPKGLEAGHSFLAAFVADAQRDGSVQRASERAGLRGIAPPEGR
jgi:polar amino acid transport system substrate-binding protein